MAIDMERMIAAIASSSEDFIPVLNLVLAPISGPTNPRNSVIPLYHFTPSTVMVDQEYTLCPFVVLDEGLWTARSSGFPGAVVLGVYMQSSYPTSINSPRKTVTPISPFSQKTSQVTGEGFINLLMRGGRLRIYVIVLPESCRQHSAKLASSVDGRGCRFIPEAEAAGGSGTLLVIQLMTILSAACLGRSTSKVCPYSVMMSDCTPALSMMVYHAPLTGKFFVFARVLEVPGLPEQLHLRRHPITCKHVNVQLSAPRCRRMVP
ncbi:hypothetical protein EDD15DRAFT_1679540 [Pisolithus albus]|nr:hypothetical protein EDD15DRAFT_1679540 [Pisolithus albus]